MEFLELKPGHFIRVPIGMNMMELSKYRFSGAELAIIALAAAGTATAVVGQVQQGAAAKKQGEFQSKIAARNAEQAIKDAEGKRQAASEAAIQKEREGRDLRGRIIGAQAKSGTAIGRGTNLSTLVQAAEDLEADRLTILREGAIAGATDEFRAGTITAQGSAAKARGTAASRASILSAVGTGATGAANVGLTASRFKSPSTKTTKTTESANAFAAHGGGR